LLAPPFLLPFLFCVVVESLQSQSCNAFSTFCLNFHFFDLRNGKTPPRLKFSPNSIAHLCRWRMRIAAVAAAATASPSAKISKSALVMVEHKTARTMLAKKRKKKKGRRAKGKLQMSREESK
jgi:hypothetical protein